MNKITTFLVIVIIALSFIVGAAIQSKAQNKTFSGIVPFVAGTDRVGFLDQNSGRIYMYDSSISQCTFIGQIQSLGQPITPVTSNSNNTSNGNQ